MIRRFFLSLLGCLSLLPGAFVPAAAQTNPAQSLTFTPVPTPAAPHLVFTPLPTSAQVQALTSQLAASQAQVKASQAQILAAQAQVTAANSQVAALTPTTWPGTYANPHTDDTHLVFVHYQLSNYLEGNQQQNGGFSGTVAGYLKDIQEAAAAGKDGFALDAGSITDGGYLGSFANMFTAADQYDAAQKSPDGTYKNNGSGVTRFRLMFLPDYSSVGEDAASVTTLADLFVQYAHRPSMFTFQGRPVLGTYVGDGAAAGQNGAQAVAGVYPALLSQIRAQGVNVLFWPGWFGTGGSTPAQECLAAGAEGNWTFVGGSPLQASSFLPSQEVQAASVKSTLTPAGKPLLWMQTIVPSGYWDGNGRNGRFYSEFGGFRAGGASWMSALLTQHPDEVQEETWNDAGEGSYETRSAATAYLPGHWGYVTNGFVPGWYQDTSGMLTEDAYYIQWYKTGVQPLITSDTLIVYNRPQLAAASLAPTSDPLGGIGAVYGILGDPPGLQDAVNATVFSTGFRLLQLSGVGPVQMRSIQPGINHVVFTGVQAGTPLLSLLKGTQVVRQVQGCPIAATAALADVNTYSAASVPGVKFTLAVPRPAGLTLDRVGIMCRSTQTSYRALGVRNLVASDVSGATPVPFLKASLNNPAAIGKTLDLATLPGDDALAQYDYGYGHGALSLQADPLDASQPPLAYIADAANSNCIYDVSGKPIPSKHIIAQCTFVSTDNNPSTDGQAGVALVSSQVNTYFGSGILAFVQKYGSAYTLTIKDEDNLLSDTLSTGPNILGSITINAMSPGEVSTLTLEDDGQALTATVTPGNQQL